MPTYTDGYGGDVNTAKDTLIQSQSPTTNYGKTSPLYIGDIGAAPPNISRGLFQFDLSGLPAGATLTAATLTLYCESEADTSDRVFGVHRGLVEWYEGIGNAELPTGENASTYNYRNANGSVAWAGGAGGAAGTEFVATPTDTVTVTDPATAYGWDVLADCQAFYAGTYTNYGWWLICADEGTINCRKRFTSSDGATTGNRPRLVITYTLGGGSGKPAYAYAQQ